MHEWRWTVHTYYTSAILINCQIWCTKKRKEKKNIHITNVRRFLRICSFSVCVHAMRSRFMAWSLMLRSLLSFCLSHCVWLCAWISWTPHRFRINGIGYTKWLCLLYCKMNLPKANGMRYCRTDTWAFQTNKQKTTIATRIKESEQQQI